MSSEIMGFQVDPNDLSCFVRDLLPGRIGYWEYSLIMCNRLSAYELLEAVCNLLRNEHNFPFLAAFGGSESELSVLDVIGCQFQDLADPHPAPGHQLQN